MGNDETGGDAEAARIRIGISACLLGQAVRFDGGHKRDAYIVGTLGRRFELVPVCPEVAIGMGVPRPPIRLVRVGDEIRVRGVDDPDRDFTAPLAEHGRRMAAVLGDLGGYIFKRGSPTCGMERVKVYTEAGRPVAQSAGAYVRTFREPHPLLPCEEEGRLGDPAVRENFIERVFVYHRWRRLLARGLTAGRLVEFHTEHEFLLLARDEAACRRMGRLVAAAGSRPLDALGHEYGAELMGAFARPAGRRRHPDLLARLF